MRARPIVDEEMAALRSAGECDQRPTAIIAIPAHNEAERIEKVFRRYRHATKPQRDANCAGCI